ncbi:CbtA family protein [Dietzia sp.]|uniref:CbtA family protein n=1 Tax=Dietzia sp. TaxID=1871616 RepID=UPI002FDB3CA1
MEKILTLRGLLFGAFGGLVAWVFMFMMAEPIIGRAIDYEEARSEAMEMLEHSHSHAAAAGHSHGGEDELFTRTIQEGLGAATGMVVLGLALGGIAAVVLAVWLYLRRSDIESGRSTAASFVLPVVGFTFAAVYVLPIIKYPANPPAVGNGDTITARTGLFLGLIVISAAVVLAGVALRRALRPRLGAGATWVAFGAGIVAMIIVYALMPQLGSLGPNAGLGSSFETPQPIVDPSDGHILLAGFDADDLYRFRLYSLFAQAIIWACIAGGLTLGARKVDALRSGNAAVGAGRSPATVAA